ncbi:Uncharacterised protein [Bordetella pertussis]|nr:Uncharacterised protein [Bordetella pertussis]
MRARAGRPAAIRVTVTVPLFSRDPALACDGPEPAVPRFPAPAAQPRRTRLRRGRYPWPFLPPRAGAGRMRLRSAARPPALGGRPDRPGAGQRGRGAMAGASVVLRRAGQPRGLCHPPCAHRPGRPGQLAQLWRRLVSRCRARAPARLGRRVRGLAGGDRGGDAGRPGGLAARRLPGAGLEPARVFPAGAAQAGALGLPVVARAAGQRRRARRGRQAISPCSTSVR